jgi:hypothetical protein
LNGQKELEGTFKNDKREGLLTTWYENGQKQAAGEYKDGELNGSLRAWYQNGRKRFEGGYRNGKEEGLLATWYENGQKGVVARYNDGRQEGLSTTWSEDGKKAVGAGPAESSAEPAVVTDSGDRLRFGKPTVKTGMGMTRVIVQAQNITDRDTSCIVMATFLKGATIMGTAKGALNRVHAGGTRTTELLTIDGVKGYDTLKLDAGTCY